MDFYGILHFFKEMEMYEKYEQLLHERGIRSADVSRATGISQSTLTDWKKGRTKVLSSESIRKLAEFFGVPTDYFYSDMANEVVDILKTTGPIDYEKNYFLDPEVQAIAEEVRTKEGMRTLFSAARDLSEEDISLVVDMIKRFKGED